MTTEDPSSSGGAKVLGMWIGKLSKELQDIREAAPEGADGIKVKMESVALELELIKVYASLLSKTMEEMGKLA